MNLVCVCIVYLSKTHILLNQSLNMSMLIKMTNFQFYKYVGKILMLIDIFLKKLLKIKIQKISLNL